MPAAPGRPHPVGLLLCRHHLRVSRAALTSAGAPADDTGTLLADGASEYAHHLREHASAAWRP